MSGFITIYNTNKETIDKQLLHSLTQTLKFRGPDQQKVWVDSNIGMGHALFKTTFEAEYENQPATIDNKVWITCSARIDDRENLVNKMGMKQSLDLSKTPDSELILHAYRKWGENCLDHLLGDFAFVIWDKDKQKLFCARDQFGKGQLYYALKNNTYIFSSTLNCIRHHPHISDKIEDRAVAGFLLFGDYTLMDKTITMFSDIRMLEPAHCASIQNGKIFIRKYWDIPSDLPLIRYKKHTEYLEHFNDIFAKSVADRIRTDRISILMSGGMDSTAIAATTRRLQQENKISNVNIQAFTAVYDRIMPCQERYYAGIAAKHLDIPIHYICGDSYTLMRPFVLTTFPLEAETLAFWMEINKSIALNARVALTGASADNLLAYSPVIVTLKEVNPLRVILDLYRLKKQYGKMPPLGTGLGSLIRGKSSKNSLMSYFPFPDYFNPIFESNMKLREVWDELYSQKSANRHPRHPVAHNFLVGIDWHTDDMIMESSFTLAEERDPYLDIRLVEFLFSIPSTPWFFRKHILRESMHTMLPKETINRPKTILGNLLAQLIKEPSSQWIKDEEISENLFQYVKKDAIKPSLWDDELYLSQQFRIIVLQKWLNKLTLD